MKIAKNNRGLSLVEVLVAVFILAIVAGPLLNVFVTNAAMLNKSYLKTTETYDAKSIMERLYPHSYTELYQQGTFGVPKLDAGSGKYYTVDLTPGGPKGVAADPVSFMHLVVAENGSGVFAGPDGKLNGGSLPTVSAADIADLGLFVGGSSYTLTSNATGATLASGTKPSTDKAVLIVNCKADTITINLNLNGAAAVLLYVPSTFPKNKITLSGVTESHIYSNGLPPETLLVNAILKTYTTSSTSTQESVFQDTFSVGNLP